MVEITKCNPAELATRPPFSSVFSIDPAILASIEASMKEDGYDDSKPINVWREHNLVIDGHTRREAAMKLGLEVAIALHDFKDEEEAFRYACDSQKNRRNISSAEYLRAIEVFDKLKKRGGDQKSEKSKASQDAIDLRKSAEETAEAVGVSTRTVERARVVLKDESAKKAVLEGKKTITKAAREIAEKKKPRSNVKHPPHPAVLAAIAAPSASACVALAERPRAIPIAAAIYEDRPQSTETTEAPAARPRFSSQQYGIDVRIYRAAKPLLDELRAILEAETGEKASVVLGPAYQAIHAAAIIPDPSFWLDCPKCNGTGFSEGRCPRCRGASYRLPQL